MITGSGGQSSPLGHVAIKHSSRLDLLLIPGRIIAGKYQWLLHMCLNGSVDGQRVDHVHSSIFDSAKDEGWANDVPLRGGLLTVLE